MILCACGSYKTYIQFGHAIFLDRNKARPESERPRVLISLTHRAFLKASHSLSRTTGSVIGNGASLRWDCSLVLLYQLSTRRTNMKSASSHSEKPQNVKRKSSSTKSKTDWDRLESKRSDVKLTAEHPEASLKHIVRGIVRRGLEPLPTKSSISLRLDRDVLEWFKAQGSGYQTKINIVLRAFRDASV